jgi:hypothetical protein
LAIFRAWSSALMLFSNSFWTEGEENCCIACLSRILAFWSCLSLFGRLLKWFSGKIASTSELAMAEVVSVWCVLMFCANLRVFVQFVRASHSSSLLTSEWSFVKVLWWFVILACLVNSLWVVQVVVLLFSGCFGVVCVQICKKGIWIQRGIHGLWGVLGSVLSKSKSYPKSRSRRSMSSSNYLALGG